MTCPAESRRIPHMPLLNRSRIREWLDARNKSYSWLAAECLVVDPDDPIDPEVMRNCVNGYDPMRVGRILLIERVTERHGDKIPYAELVAADEEKTEGVKEEKTHPDRRKNGGGSGPKRASGAAA